MPLQRELVSQPPSALQWSSSMICTKQSPAWVNVGCVSSNGLTAKQATSSDLCSASGFAGPAVAVYSCVSEGVGHKERQALLWEHFFFDPSDWWDNRADKRSPRHPDFRHKTSKEPLWLNSSHKPAWVDSELASLDVRMGGPRVCSLGNDEEQKAILQACEESDLRKAVEKLDFLVHGGCHVTAGVFYRFLKRCIVQKDIVYGRRIHTLTVRCGYESNAFLANQIIGMYAGHGKLEDAVQVFNKVSVPDVYMWSSIIFAHARHGESERAVKLYLKMREGSVKADNHIFVAALTACASAEDLDSGKQVHADIQASAVKPDTFVATSLVNMYAKCGSLEDARKVFDCLPSRNVETWNAIIGGYSQRGLAKEALNLYGRMQHAGSTLPNNVTFVCLLQACASLGDLQQGKQLHSQIRERGFEADAVIGNCLVNMYAKCGDLKAARNVFDGLPRRDLVTWNAMIAGYSQQGLGREALALYASMQDDGMTLASHVTFVCLLQACASLGALQQGKQLHSQIRERNLEADPYIGSCLVDMYSKCGSLEDARDVFDRLPVKNLVTCTAMIAGYTQQGLGREALSLFSSMQVEGSIPVDRVTFICLLQACASVGALQLGKQIHAQLRERDLEADARVGNCLVDMYAKCGSLEDARNVFDSLPTRDLVTWTTLLNGYAEHGDGAMAMTCFEQMLHQGVQPDETTFICLFVACSHAGLVHEGQEYFRSMVEDHGIVPSDRHYSCLVDLLSRSGQLDAAENVLRTTAVGNDVVAWTALLSACKSYGDVERGRRCFDSLVAMEAEDASWYVLLGNIYANASRWDEVSRIESMRKSAGAVKKPARACIEVKNEVHEFTVGQKRPDISSHLQSVNTRLKEGGHLPQTELVLRAMSELEKEDALCGHAEKLALAYGLLNTPDGATLLVTKNLRMCNDCHSSTKIMSRLEKREIIVRDAHRVHRFQDGSCSCRDRH